MIAINLELCTGCGACLASCPQGALYLVDGKAAVDDALCRECRADLVPCIGVCPEGAIALVAQTPQPGISSARASAVQPPADVIRIETRPEPAPLRARVLPVVGAALTWAGREIVPRLADYLLRRSERQTGGQRADLTSSGAASRRGTKGGGGCRHRRRGG